MDILNALPAGDLGVLALGLVIAGVVGGLLSGVLGTAGGIVVVPVLYHVLATLHLDAGVRMHVAIGTSLAAGLPAALAKAHGIKTDGDGQLVWRWYVPLLAGIVLGCALLAVLPGETLAVIFAVAATGVVLLTLLRAPPVRAPMFPHLSVGLALAATTGVSATITGMGGATIAGPLLTICGVSPPRTQNVVALSGAVVGAAATLGAMIAGWRAQPLPPNSLGYVNLIGFALFAPVLLLTEPAGAALAHMIDTKRLRLVFSALIAITTARMLWDALA
ncbi:MAG TPA: sulfite exporter TauE/SafE family protein [Rhizomicrobium sp.]